MSKSAAGFCALAFLLYAAPSHAQATRTWVSGVGDDVNPCSRTAPCKTFAGALSKTARDGEISVLDPGGFGAVTIAKSITINGTPGSGYGSIVASLVNGVIISITDPTDTKRTVRLNWLDINGLGNGLNGIRILNSANSVVIVENSVIDGFAGRGISDERSQGGKLLVRNTTIRNTVGAGIITIPSSGSVKIDSSIDNVRAYNTGAGFAVLGGGKMTVSNSVASGGTIGLDAEGAGTEMLVSNTMVSNNATGIFQNTATLRLAHSDVAFNTLGINGTVNSFTNNRFVSNGAGGTITPIGGPTNDTGQQ
jgi:hypothetical protein